MDMLIVSQIYVSSSQLSLEPMDCLQYLCSSCSPLKTLCYGAPASHLGSYQKEVKAQRKEVI